LISTTATKALSIDLGHFSARVRGQKAVEALIETIVKPRKRKTVNSSLEGQGEKPSKHEAEPGPSE
jgi:hypothetical protein